MSRARQCHERCGEADAARVTLPKATAPAPLYHCLLVGAGLRSGRGLHTLVRRQALRVVLPVQRPDAPPRELLDGRVRQHLELAYLDVRIGPASES